MDHSRWALGNPRRECTISNSIVNHSIRTEIEKEKVSTIEAGLILVGGWGQWWRDLCWNILCPQISMNNCNSWSLKNFVIHGHWIEFKNHMLGALVVLFTYFLQERHSIKVIFECVPDEFHSSKVRVWICHSSMQRYCIHTAVMKREECEVKACNLEDPNWKLLAIFSVIKCHWWSQR